MKKIIIAAVSLNNIIGVGNKIPWDNKEEINHFKETTINNAILMGRKTFKSIGKPLEGRTNLILSKTRNHFIESSNLFYFNSIEIALLFADENNNKKTFIIGGSEIYSQMINKVDELLISRLPFEVKGDKHFPKIDEDIWELKETKKFNSFSVEKYFKRSD